MKLAVIHLHLLKLHFLFPCRPFAPALNDQSLIFNRDLHVLGTDARNLKGHDNAVVVVQHIGRRAPDLGVKGRQGLRGDQEILERLHHLLLHLYNILD